MHFDRWSTVADFQHQVQTWSEYNFGNQPAHRPLLGVAEEVGELCHAFLKTEQQIRMEENHEEATKDAVGDIIIYLADFCSRTGLSLEECIRTTWNEVQMRDWTKHG